MTARLRTRALFVAGLLAAVLTVVLLTRSDGTDTSLRGAERTIVDGHDKTDEPKEVLDEGAPQEFTYGFEARLSDSAVKPSDLVSSVDRDIRLHNDNATPVEIEFLNWFPNGDDQPRRVSIAPGDAFVVRSSSTVSIVYEVVGRSDLRGSILIESEAG